jgi:hypothetical protein
MTTEIVFWFILYALVIAVYYMTGKMMWKKWNYLGSVWKIFYILLILLPGAGPLPILLLLYLDVGVQDHTQSLQHHYPLHP